MSPSIAAEPRGHRAALASYRALCAVAAAGGAPYLIWRALAHGSEMRERFALGWERESGRPLWLHAASVGEVRGLVAVGRALAASKAPLFATAMTPGGLAALKRALPGMTARFLPLDLPAAPERAFGRVHPRSLVVFETELWPGLWSAARARHVPVAVANARLTDRALRRYESWGALWRPLARGAALVAAQSPVDAERWVRLGASPEAVLVTGSTKHDLSVDEEGGRRVRERLEGRRLFVAGSTRPGEEAIVLDAWMRAHLPAEWLLVIAPRHAARFEEVAALLRAGGQRWARWSAADPVAGSAGVLLADTLGDLNGFYAACRAAFVGGSLLPFGGHNVLEPAVAGVPVLFGPHTENAGESAAHLRDAGGGLVVTDAAEMAQVLGRLLTGEAEIEERGGAARAVAAKESGATQRLLEAMERKGIL